MNSTDVMSVEIEQRTPSREFVKKAALAFAFSGITPALGFAQINDAVPTEGFVHRTYNGWITDLATEPDPDVAWPSMRIDERLLADYRETFALMSRLGFNEINIWGLYVANNWPLELERGVSAEPGKLVERLIKNAHGQNIKVLSGLGTYSWGFTEIIKANPKLNGGNPNALCASEPESHLWMQRIVDFMFKRFEIDGVSMQSADLGRCKCERCAKRGDAEYHADLIVRTAEHIRSKWPDKIIGMSNWGVPFGNPNDLAAFKRMSQPLDYMVDWNDSVRRGGPSYRQGFIKSLKCTFGTTGGPVVEPPQHWSRDRWFLPTCKRVHQHLQKLYADGGRASEYFFHILENPGSEITLHVAGRTLKDPSTSLETHLKKSLQELYQPKSSASLDALATFFLDVEDAYFKHLPGDECGTISLEPLVSDKVGPPVYLRDRIKPHQREEYGKDVARITENFERIRSGDEIPPNLRMDRISACLKSVRDDCAS